MCFWKSRSAYPGRTDAVIEAARRADRMVIVNHELRVSHQWGAVRELIASGAIGRVRSQRFSLFRRGFRPGSGGWRTDDARVGSWSLEELVHFVDLLAWYAQESGEPRVAAVFASGTSGEAKSAKSDTITAVLEWPDGATAVVSQCLAGFEHHTLLEIAGSDGAIRTWWTGAEDRAAQAAFELAVRGGDAPERLAIPRSGEVYELREHLSRAIAAFRGGPPTITLADARRAVALCLDIDRLAAAAARGNSTHSGPLANKASRAAAERPRRPQRIPPVILSGALQRREAGNAMRSRPRRLAPAMPPGLPLRHSRPPNHAGPTGMNGGANRTLSGEP